MKKMWTFLVGVFRSLSLSHSLSVCDSLATDLPTCLAFWSRFFSVERGKINFSRCRCCRLIQVSRNIRWWMCNFLISLSPSLARCVLNVMALDCVRWLNGISGISHPRFFLWFWRTFSIINFFSFFNSRDQLYHSNSPECVNFSSCSFFWFNFL
jgi:hypothetical protein